MKSNCIKLLAKMCKWYNPLYVKLVRLYVKVLNEEIIREIHKED